MRRVICIGLALVVGSFFEVNVLVDRIGIEGRMLKFIGKRLLVVAFLIIKFVV